MLDAGLTSTLHFFLENPVIVLWVVGMLFMTGLSLMYGFASQSLLNDGGFFYSKNLMA